MIPVAEHTKANKVSLLQCDLRFGVRTRKFHHFFSGKIFAVFFLDNDFDGHAVAIPTGNIDRVKTGKLFRFDDHVFQNLVDRMADVDRGVRVWRAIVQDEFRTAFGLLANLFVELALLPLRHPIGLALGQIAAHGKRRIG